MKKKQLVHVGTFGQPQGLKGDIKINIFTSSFESFKKLKNYFIEDKKSILVFKKIRQVGNKIIGSVEKCEDRDAALLFKGKYILALRESFPGTRHNEYYIVDLIGCEVFDLKNNILGEIKNIQNFGAGDLMEIKNHNKKNFFIPMNNENLINVDLEKKIIIVNPIKGILE
jgi:16S rRNA processing protein RimM